MNEIIPIFYAADDNFVKYTLVSLTALKENADRSRSYHIYILLTTVSEELKASFNALAEENFKIEFVDVSAYLAKCDGKLHVRDYYSKTTYYRLFIAEMYPDYDKALYIDSDTVVIGNVAELYDHDLGENYVGACHEQAMVQMDVYGTYVEQVLGIDRNRYFNAGMLLINCRLFREEKLLERFLDLLRRYTFVVTQDEDYLNVLCENRVLWLNQGWNTEVIGEIRVPREEMKIIHYIMTSKPWHYADCRLGDIFWSYAEKTPVYDLICADRDSYTDEMRENDRASCDRLAETARQETARTDTYFQDINRGKSIERCNIVKKIARFEREARFAEDVEDDLPGRILEPGEVNYLNRGIWARLQAHFAFRAAYKFADKLKKSGGLIIDDFVGIENFRNLASGAIITCNHFNALDSFAIHLAYDEAKQKKRKFYRVIREGNYTAFPGFYGRLMRHCNTLPLSENRQVMKEFTKATYTLLEEGHFVLIYPEQSMWWNYRKPKPLQPGAFHFAAKANVPVLPCFITMRDTDTIGEDGFPVQAYTVHIGKPIYPDAEKSLKDRTQEMLDENYRVWGETYERIYGEPVTYSCTDRPFSAE